MAEQDKNNQTNITPFGAAPTNTFGGVYMQPSQFATPQMQQPRYKSPTSFAPNVQPQQVQPVTTERVQPINQPISYDVTGQAGQIQLPTGGASSFVPDVRQYKNEAGNVLFIPFVNGKPLYPIPEGYIPVGEQDEKQKEKEQITQTATVTKQDDDDGGDNFDVSTLGQTSSREGITSLSDLGNFSLASGQLDTAQGAMTALNGLDSISVGPKGIESVGLSRAARVAASLAPVPGLGTVVSVGNAMSRGAAITTLANTLGVPTDSMGALGAAISGVDSNMAQNISGMYSPQAINMGIEMARLDAMDAALSTGFAEIGTVTDSKGNVTGHFGKDKDGNYSFTTLESFIDANFNGRMNSKTAKDIAEEKSSLRETGLVPFGLTKEPPTFREFRDQMGLSDLDSDFDDSSLGIDYGQTDEGQDIGFGIGQETPSFDAFSEALGTSTSDDDGDDDGGGDDGGDDGGFGDAGGPGDPGDSAGLGGEDVNKGGFINKKHMGKKKTQPKRKGLAAK